MTALSLIPELLMHIAGVRLTKEHEYESDSNCLLDNHGTNRVGNFCRRSYRSDARTNKRCEWSVCRRCRNKPWLPGICPRNPRDLEGPWSNSGGCSRFFAAQGMGICRYRL